MLNKDVRFKVELDDQSVPEKIFWEATDGTSKGLEECKAVAVSVWDHNYRETLRIDLWTKDLPIDEMKRMVVDTIGGLANTVLSATGDKVMSDEMNTLCDKLVKHLKAEQQKQQQSGQQ